MNTTELNIRKSTELVSTLNSFGYWPIISSKWSANDFDLTELMINIGLSRAADVFVDIYVSQDQKDAEKRMMHVSECRILIEVVCYRKNRSNAYNFSSIKAA